MSNTSTPPSLKWNQHPVIATVLWILGTEHSAKNGINNENEKSANFNSQGKLNVIWKDEQGGNINEYISQVQSNNSHYPSSSSSKTTVASNLSRQSAAAQLFPTFQSAQLDENSTITPDSTAAFAAQQTNNVNPQNNGDNPVYDATTPSPQWGFYVPITPPQQDSFSRRPDA